MQLDARGHVSIVEIVVFTPLLVLAFHICLRHGFKKSSGWIFLFMLCLIRIVGMILSIVGGTRATITATGLEVTTPTKIAILLYIAGFVLTIGVLVVAATRLSTVPKGEHRLAIAAAIALPFIAVRLVFSALAVFVHNATFSVIGDQVGVYVGMALVEEF